MFSGFYKFLFLYCTFCKADVSHDYSRIWKLSLFLIISLISKTEKSGGTSRFVSWTGTTK